MITLVKSELKRLFFQPAGWVAASAVFSLAGVVFQQSALNLLEKGASLNAAGDIVFDLNTVLSLFLLFIIPIFPAKYWVGDKLGGRLKALQSMGVGLNKILYSKLIAISIYIVFIISLLFAYPFFISFFSEIHWPSLLLAYSGLFLFSLFVLSFSFFVATLCQSVVSAYLSTSLGLMGFSLYTASEFAPAFLKEHFHLVGHVNAYSMGTLPIHISFLFFTLISFFLYCSHLGASFAKGEKP